MLIGCLGKSPEMRFTPNGVSVANFSLACERNWRDSNGVKQSTTEWFNIVAWGPLAEVAKEHLNKGSKVYIEGHLQSRTWQDKEGHQHRSFEIIARDLLMLNNQNIPGTIDGSEKDNEYSF